MKLAVTGRDGQVARALAEVAAAAGITLIPLARPEVDLTRPETIAPALHAAGVDAVISAAAFTAVDAAESDADAAFAINEGGARAVALAAADLNIPILHLSTDYVFDGSGDTPWREGDATGPLGVYGASKLAGERAVAAATDNHAILRTAWVYSPFGANFVKTMLRVGADRDELKVVEDQIGHPTSAHHIASALIGIARNLTTSPDPALRGTFHMVAEGTTSWAGFARETFAVASRHGFSAPRVTGITTSDYPTPAARPGNSRLDTTKLSQAHGIALPRWQEGTSEVVNRLMENRT